MCRTLQIHFLFTLSKAFPKSMKSRCSEDLNSMQCWLVDAEGSRSETSLLLSVDLENFEMLFDAF